MSKPKEATSLINPPTPLSFGGMFRRQLGLITEDELAETIGVSVNTLVAWRNKRTGPPCVKLGRSIFYRANDIAQYVSQLPEINPPDYDKLRAAAMDTAFDKAGAT